jgi:asparagine synthetase B (glutamine-hydrolysing)
MYGIEGNINFNNKTNVEEIKTIMRSIKHRGPNGDGFSVGTGINFEFHVEKKNSYQYMFGI